MNAGFNFFGQTNTVVAGPGPLALAGSVFKDNQVVTKTNAGIAINNVRIGGAAVQGGQSSTVPTANAVPTNTAGDPTKRGAAAAATPGSKKKAGNATGTAAAATSGSKKKAGSATGYAAGATSGSKKNSKG